jgi:hypothetical protein
VEVCVRCHGPGTEFGTSLEPERSSTAATFLHDRHVGQYRNGEPITCTTCHTWGPRPGTVGTFGLHERFAGDAYRGCIECHEQRDVEEHQTFSTRRDECSHCHALAEGSLTDFFELRTSRPTVSVPRPDPAGFSFAVHAHSQLDLGEDCGACHRGQTQAGASDINNRPFDHRSHLTPEVLERMTREGLTGTEADEVRSACNVCHLELVKSKGPESFVEHAAADADPLREVFDRQACAKCHGQQVAVEFELVPTPMLHFSHDDHLRKTFKDPDRGNRRLDCLDCHRADPEAAQGSDPLTLEVLPEAANCRQCHGHHDRAPTRVPSDLSQEAVLKCAYCHTVGVPEPGRGVDVPRQRLTGMMMNVHPHETAQPPPEGRCNDCHLDRLERGPVGRPVSDYDPGARAAGSVTMASVGPGRFFSSPGNNTSPHRPNLAAARRRDFGSNDREFRDILPKAEKTGYSCLYCHWADLDPRDGNPSMIWDKFQLGQAPEVRRNQGAALDADWEPGLRNAQPR